MIDPAEVIASASIAEHCRRAEAYFQAVEEPDRLLDKPFVSLAETPLLLYRLGLLLAGLKVAPTMRVLDFGAGTCWVAHLLASLRCHVVCVDASETALALGRRLFERRPVPEGIDPPQFLRFDGEHLPVESGSIDRVICFDALHHVPNPGRVFAEFHRVLKDGGRAGFSEPGRQHSQSPVSQYEMQHYGVIENDIRLEDLETHADAAGFSALLAAAETGVDTWLPLDEAEPVWQLKGLPERWTHANLHSFHSRATFVLQKGAYVPDSRLGEGLGGSLRVDERACEVRAGEPLVLDVEVRNTGSARWLARNTPDIGTVRIGAKVRPADAPAARPDVRRVDLPHDVDAGTSLVVPVALTFAEPGAFTVDLDLLDEQIVWFETLGLTPPRLAVTVTPRPDDSEAARTGTLPLPYALTLASMPSSRLEGFAAPEPFGRWSIGTTATIDVPAPLPPRFRLTLHCQAFGPNVGRDLVVSVGGVGRACRLVDHVERAYALDYDDVPPTSRVVVTVPAPVSPRSLGVGDDDRRLGIALRALSIERAAPA